MMAFKRNEKSIEIVWVEYAISEALRNFYKPSREALI